MQPYLKLVADGVFHSYIFFQLFEDVRVSVRRRFVIKPRGKRKEKILPDKIWRTMGRIYSCSINIRYELILLKRMLFSLF